MNNKTLGIVIIVFGGLVLYSEQEYAWIVSAISIGIGSGIFFWKDKKNNIDTQSMSKQILIIFGHNNYKAGSSFNAAVRDSFIDEAKKIGHKIDLVNIYEEKQIKFWDGEKPNEQILNYRKRLEQADIFMIMSPCHNYIMNSATENFIANVFTPPWSFSYKKIIGNWGYPVPNALKGKTAIISMTYGGPSFFVSAIIQQIPRRIKKMVFSGLCGANVQYLRFYEVLPNMPTKIFEKNMKKVRKFVHQL